MFISWKCMPVVKDIRNIITRERIPCLLYPCVYVVCPPVGMIAVEVELH